MAHPLQTVLEAHKAALEAYKTDIDQLSAMESRLIGQLDEKRTKLKSFKSEAKGKALLAEAKTLVAQIEKVCESAKEATQRFNAKVDDINASVVQQFKGLCAYAVGTGNATAGVRYLYGQCEDFDKAKGDFELRNALYDSVTSTAAAITSADDAAEKKGSIAADQLAIYETFESMSDGEQRTAYFKKHKDVIAAVHDLLRLR